MRYEAVKDLGPGAFKRLTGVKPEVFREMVRVLRDAETRKKKTGRPSKLSPEDRLLAMSYWRDTGRSFISRRATARTGKARPVGPSSLHESSVNRIITQVEDTLISSGAFSLPKRREVSETDWTVVLLDATETPVERPQKNSGATTAARKNATR